MVPLLGIAAWSGTGKTTLLKALIPLLRERGIRTGLMGERFGGQVLDTVDIENYISVPKTEGQKLAGALKAHVDDYDVDVIDTQ
ncbi:molybdopterin-guanine dinucleotide biosynthesis protein MobB, partial [Leptospira borgpetersenii serovar Balcanica]|nr:molybdopterin-guanine dinucleotide biosynthesis protein MobB [Leptospira borgpetersenii serovar Balcanica]